MPKADQPCDALLTTFSEVPIISQETRKGARSSYSPQYLLSIKNHWRSRAKHFEGLALASAEKLASASELLEKRENQLKWALSLLGKVKGSIDGRFFAVPGDDNSYRTSEAQPGASVINKVTSEAEIPPVRKRLHDSGLESTKSEILGSTNSSCDVQSSDLAMPKGIQAAEEREPNEAALASEWKAKYLLAANQVAELRSMLKKDSTNVIHDAIITSARLVEPSQREVEAIETCKMWKARCIESDIAVKKTNNLLSIAQQESREAMVKLAALLRKYKRLKKRVHISTPHGALADNVSSGSLDTEILDKLAKPQILSYETRDFGKQKHSTPGKVDKRGKSHQFIHGSNLFKSLKHSNIKTEGISRTSCECHAEASDELRPSSQVLNSAKQVLDELREENGSLHKEVIYLRESLATLEGIETSNRKLQMEVETRATETQHLKQKLIGVENDLALAQSKVEFLEKERSSWHRVGGSTEQGWRKAIQTIKEDAEHRWREKMQRLKRMRDEAISIKEALERRCSFLEAELQQVRLKVQQSTLAMRNTNDEKHDEKRSFLDEETPEERADKGLKLKKSQHSYGRCEYREKEQNNEEKTSAATILSKRMDGIERSLRNFGRYLTYLDAQQGRHARDSSILCLPVYNGPLPAKREHLLALLDNTIEAAREKSLMYEKLSDSKRNEGEANRDAATMPHKHKCSYDSLPFVGSSWHEGKEGMDEDEDRHDLNAVWQYQYEISLHLLQYMRDIVVAVCEYGDGDSAEGRHREIILRAVSMVCYVLVAKVHSLITQTDIVGSFVPTLRRDASRLRAQVEAAKRQTRQQQRRTAQTLGQITQGHDRQMRHIQQQHAEERERLLEQLRTKDAESARLERALKERERSAASKELEMSAVIGDVFRVMRDAEQLERHVREPCKC